jgi:hypothetical protein
MADKTKSGEQPLRKLPVGHPKAGYVGPDLSFRDSAGTLPDEDEQVYEDAVAEREDLVAKIAEAEDAAAKEEEAEAEAAAEEASPQPKAASTPKATAAKQ